MSISGIPKPQTAALEIAVLDRLADTPSSIPELADALGVIRPRVEHCVKRLHWAGLIETVALRASTIRGGRPQMVRALARTKRNAV